MAENQSPAMLCFEGRSKLADLPGSPDRDGTDVGFPYDEVVGVVIERNILLHYLTICGKLQQ
jgi:hypothetical protein